MKTPQTLQVPLRAIGNSHGIVIPKPFLVQAGFEGTVDLTIEGSAIVLRKPSGRVREGWSVAAQDLAKHGDDTLVMGEFSNADDADLAW